MENKKVDFNNIITHRSQLIRFEEDLEAMRKRKALEVVLYPFEYGYKAD